MRRWAPDVVQTYGFYSNLPGLLAAYGAGVPVRIAGRRELGDLSSAAQRRLDRWVWRLAQHVVVNADAVRRQLVAVDGVAPEKVVVIRNGVNIRKWPPPDHGRADGGNALVGMVAHFREQKDHTTFLRAAKEVLRVAPGVRFWLVGSGALEQATREYACQLGLASSVEFLGLLEGEALGAAVGRFGVSVLTSKNNEGLPNAVLESMAVGIPVVATAVGGVPEIVEDGVTGYLVPPEAPAALADRVICLLKDPSGAGRMGAAGRRKIEREFGIERMVDEFHGLYRARLKGQCR
jgi:glycosyltransferase involved in cell wall biosynthesis